MSNRREFLKETGILAGVAPFLTGGLRAAAGANPSSVAAASEDKSSQLGFKPHWIKQGDGRGGWVLRPAEIQFLHWGDGTVPYYEVKGDGIKPFGVAEMDNGELILVASWDSGEPPEKPVVAFSRDQGRTWSKFERIEGGEGRPIVLTYLGKGNLSFQTDTYLTKPYMQYFSSDYGRTWPERQPLQFPPHVELYYTEGNALVDRDSQGVAKRIAQAGGSFEKGKPWPVVALGTLRWSSDGGRTWTNETVPEWQWEVEYQGKNYTRGIDEGSLVRATNGWLVAALRTNCHPRFIDVKNDNLEGIGVSVSKDDGKTWSPVQVLYEGGRMHTHLLRMPNKDLVLTHIMRQDIRYLLDDFEFSDGMPFALACGHQFSTLLGDGQILTAFGNYTAKGACLIKWKPTTR